MNPRNVHTRIAPNVLSNDGTDSADVAVPLEDIAGA